MLTHADTFASPAAPLGLATTLLAMSATGASMAAAPITTAPASAPEPLADDADTPAEPATDLSEHAHAPQPESLPPAVAPQPLPTAVQPLPTAVQPLPTAVQPVPTAVQPVPEAVPEAAATAEPAVVPVIEHDGVACTGCGQRPLRGTRYACTACAAVDLCETCEPAHPATHVLFKLRVPVADAVRSTDGFRRLFQAAAPPIRLGALQVPLPGGAATSDVITVVAVRAAQGPSFARHARGRD